MAAPNIVRVPTFDERIERVGRQLPAVLIAVVLLAAIGFGSGILEWRQYSGIRVSNSGFLTTVGLFSLCLVAAKAVEWAIRRIGASAPPR